MWEYITVTQAFTVKELLVFSPCRVSSLGLGFKVYCLVSGFRVRVRVTGLGSNGLNPANPKEGIQLVRMKMNNHSNHDK